MASGADLAKFDKYLSEKVKETAFSRMIDTPTSVSSAAAAPLVFFAGYEGQPQAVGQKGE